MRLLGEPSETVEMASMASSVTREQVMEMMKQKEGLEEELKALQDVLKSQGVGMEEPLVDGEGFPRSDIDVYQVMMIMLKIMMMMMSCNRCGTLGTTSGVR